jgi:hypothetical protein
MHEELPRTSAAQDRRLDHSLDHPACASESIACMLDGCAEQLFVFGRRGKGRARTEALRAQVRVRGELQRLELRHRVREGQVRQVERDSTRTSEAAFVTTWPSTTTAPRAIVASGSVMDRCMRTSSSRSLRSCTRPFRATLTSFVARVAGQARAGGARAHPGRLVDVRPYT